MKRERSIPPDPPKHLYDPPIGIYEHFKSTQDDRRYYQVIGFARHTETNETMVVYLSLYVIPEHPGLRMHVRPLSMFIEDVEHLGNTVPRFKYIGVELR